MSDVESEQPPEEPVVSEEEIEEDFESTKPDSPDPRIDNTTGALQLSVSLPLATYSQESATRNHPVRSGSMATVKLQRRARLAEKLRDIFELTGIEEVIAGQFNDLGLNMRSR